MRDLREHLTASSGLQRSIDYDMVAAYARNYRQAWIQHIFLAMALACAASLWVSPQQLIVGCLAIVTTVVLTGLACKRFLAADPGLVSLPTWRVALILSELAHGTGWVLFLAPLLAHGESPHSASEHGFVIIAVLVVMTATSVLRAPLIAAVAAGIAPLTAVLVTIASHAGEPETVAMALLALSAQAFLLYFAYRLERAAAATYRARAEMRARFAELEQISANTHEVRRQADEANRAKAQFLATMSHELRTPLNAILGFSEVMKNEVLGQHSTPSYREYSSDIHGSGQHLLALINEILDLSRIESGQYTLAEETVRLGDLVAAGAALMAPRAEAKGHAVSVSIDPSLDPVRVDPAAVRQIVVNLLSNAIKFTAPGGLITVKAGWTSRGGQYVSVTDDGPGIPAEEIPVALSSFGRGSLAVQNAEQGAGLGLPIVKGLADLHGGRFVLRSEPRKGTEAAVIFPAARTLSHRDEPAAPQVPAADAA
ncbi:MAG TPA: HAMP domain-containing sensor histidine kinase [Microvirga sp.]